MTASLFEPAGLAAMLARLDALRPDARRAWGKMDAAQMLAHCQQPLRVALGELQLKRMLIGFLFGRLAKKKLLAPQPWKPGMPTAPQFVSPMRGTSPKRRPRCARWSNASAGAARKRSPSSRIRSSGR